MNSAPIFSEAATLFGTARKMMDAVCVLYQRDSAHFFSTNNFLTAFTIELFLKAALAEHGVKGGQRWGHDLEPLYKLADESGLIEFSHKVQLGQMVDILSRGHKEHSFRYLKPDATVSYLTSIDAGLHALNALEQHLGSRINLNPL